MKRFLLASAILLAFCGLARGEHYEVFILAGQSNMDGRGKKAELTGPLAGYAKRQPDVTIAYSNSTKRGPYTSGGFRPLEPGYSVPPGTKKPGDAGPQYTLPGATFGPEVSFGRAIADGMPGKRIALIKFSEGGTSLRADWSPEARDALYDQFLAFTRASLASLTNDNHTYTLAGMIWHQGESDASLPDGAYEKLLTKFIARVREDLTAPEMVFVIGEVFDNGRRDRVRAGQRATSAGVARAYLVSCEGLSTSDAGTHFDTPSQIELGKRLARAILAGANVHVPATSPARQGISLERAPARVMILDQRDRHSGGHGGRQGFGLCDAGRPSSAFSFPSFNPSTDVRARTDRTSTAATPAAHWRTVSAETAWPARSRSATR